MKVVNSRVIHFEWFLRCNNQAKKPKQSSTIKVSGLLSTANTVNATNRTVCCRDNFSCKHSNRIAVNNAVLPSVSMPLLDQKTRLGVAASINMLIVLTFWLRKINAVANSVNAQAVIDSIHDNVGSSITGNIL